MRPFLPAWPWPSFLLGVALLCPGRNVLAQGGPPLLTDDPGTPGDGVWEINIALTGEKTETGWSLETPLLDVNYGVGERVQLKFEAPWVVQHDEAEDGSSRTVSGSGNWLAGIKWRFLDQEETTLDVSVYPQVEFNPPTSSVSRGIVEEGTALSLPIQFEKAVGPFSFNPEIGYVLLDGEDEWLYGLALGFEPVPGLDLLAELHGEAELDFGEDELVFQVGGRWKLLDELRVLLAVGRGLRDSDEGGVDIMGYFGIQLLFGGESGK